MKSDQTKLIKRALRLLGLRQYSSLELKQKFGAESQIVIDYLIEHKLLDDKQFAIDWTASRHRRGKSLKQIKIELKNKGIDPETIENTTKAIDEVESIDQILLKKPSLLINRQKCFAYLYQKGFSSTAIEKALKSRYN